MKIIENIFYNDSPNGCGDLFCTDKAVDSNYAILLIHGGGWNSMDKKDAVALKNRPVDAVDNGMTLEVEPYSAGVLKIERTF